MKNKKRNKKWWLPIVGLSWLIIACANGGYLSMQSKYMITKKVDKLAIADTALQNMINEYKMQLDGRMHHVIGISDEDMVVRWHSPESKLPNFIADVLLEIGQNFCKEQNLPHSVDLAVFNKGGIRSDLPKGKITFQNIYEMLPFKNHLVIVGMKGRDLVRLLDYVAKVGGESVAGVKMGIYKKRAANMLVKGRPIQKDKVYYIISVDYLANGGGGFEPFQQRETFRHLHKKLRNTIIEYIKEKNARGEHLKSVLDKRIYYVE